jgi:hypothetical protein
MHIGAIGTIYFSLLKLQYKMALEIKHQQNDIVYEDNDIRSPHLHILLC